MHGKHFGRKVQGLGIALKIRTGVKSGFRQRFRKIKPGSSPAQVQRADEGCSTQSWSCKLIIMADD